MAVMVPEVISPTTASTAEREVFGRIRGELGKDWTVLHSLGLTVHDRKPWAEIDFVMIGPPGIFCLEVKGGTVSRHGGHWYTSPVRGARRGQPVQLKESPFQQVGSASAALHKYLVRRLPDLRGTVTGYAVAVPDCRWTVTGPDTDPVLVYDGDDAAAGFDRFMDRVVAHWRRRLGGGTGQVKVDLRSGDRARVLKELCGDFDLVESVHGSIERSAGELVRLTTEQAQLLARLKENSRVMARGGAGTGKTLLAVAEARRLAREGHRVLLTCFSRNLALHLRDEMVDTPAIEVSTLHSLMYEVIRASGRAHELPDASESDLFAIFCPDLATEILLDESEPRFEALVVDEGQDLLAEPHLDVLDACLSGGLAGGTWRWFLDPNQDLFESVAPAAVERLRSLEPVDWPLAVNCRNTRPIADQVALLSGTPRSKTVQVDGPNVEFHFYANREDERQKVASRARRLLRSGVSPRDVTLLSARRLESSCVAHGLGNALPTVADVSRGGVGGITEGSISFSTVASFKGLESDSVFLMDVEDLASPAGLASVYVGASRARAHLVVFVAESTRPDFESRSRDFGRALVRETPDETQ